MKLFEEYNQYYTNISESEYHHRTKSATRIGFRGDSPFTIPEINKLRLLLKIQRVYGFMEDSGFNLNERCPTFLEISHDSFGTWMGISKYEDEWYYVYTNEWIVDTSKNYRIKSDECLYYKCDQFDGLEKLIKDKIGIF